MIKRLIKSSVGFLLILCMVIICVAAYILTGNQRMTAENKSIFAENGVYVTTAKPDGAIFSDS